MLRFDTNGRPAEIRRYDYDYGTNLNKKLFSWGEEDETDQVDTIVFTEKTGSDDNSELDWMKQNGWTPVGDFQTQRSFTPAANSWLV